MLTKSSVTQRTARFVSFIPSSNFILIVFQAYDRCGVWPPPTAQESYTQGNWQRPAREPFQDPFFQDPFVHHPFFGRSHQADPFFPSSRHPHFHDFTDPFILFNRIFGDLHQAFSGDPFGDSFGRRDDGFFGRGFMSPMSMSHITSSPFGFLTGGNVNVYSSSSRGGLAGGPNGSRWVSESYTTSTVNGVTHTKAVRRDSQVSDVYLYIFTLTHLSFVRATSTSLTHSRMVLSVA